MGNIRSNLAQRVKARQDRRAMKYGRPTECIKLVRQTEQHQCSLALSLGNQALSIEAAVQQQYLLFICDMNDEYNCHGTTDSSAREQRGERMTQHFVSVVANLLQGVLLLQTLP